MNDRIEVDSGDVDYGQLAPSKALRTDFTPGKAASLPGDMNWPTDFRTPTGTPAFDGESVGPVEMQRVRTAKLGRNVVCDQELVSVPVDPANTTQDNDGRKERRAGNDWVVGA
jgi:hypothetical protein